MLNELWVGVLIGVPVGAFAPSWAKIATFVVALILGDLRHVNATSHNVSSPHFAVPLWLFGVIGLGIGIWAWHYARKRGLEQLGKAELRNRWNSVRGISKWGW